MSTPTNEALIAYAVRRLREDARQPEVQAALTRVDKLMAGPDGMIVAPYDDLDAIRDLIPKTACKHTHARIFDTYRRTDRVVVVKLACDDCGGRGISALAPEAITWKPEQEGP